MRSKRGFCTLFRRQTAPQRYRGNIRLFYWQQSVTITKKNKENIKSVIISEGVTSIGERLFQHCDNLKTVSLPTTLTAIKKATFLPHIDGYIYHQSLNGLTELKIPERVTELGVNAFAGTAIKSVTVPFSVTTVGAMTFSEVPVSWNGAIRRQSH